MDWCVEQQSSRAASGRGGGLLYPVYWVERVAVQAPQLHMLSDTSGDGGKDSLDQCHVFVFLFEINWGGERLHCSPQGFALDFRL